MFNFIENTICLFWSFLKLEKKNKYGMAFDILVYINARFIYLIYNKITWLYNT